jgi:nitrite reductase/ring-hydroxylating ferredoxin subunit
MPGLDPSIHLLCEMDCRVKPGNDVERDDRMCYGLKFRGVHDMPEVFVAKIADIPDGERKIVQHGAHDIGVFHWEGQFYAYANMCLHQGGPACEGLIMHQVEDVIGPDKTWVGQKFSDSQVNFVCPWHGYEYDLKTGECAADRRLRLKKYNVVRRGDDIFVNV